MPHVESMNNKVTPLHRPDEGRWLAGVAAGLSLRFRVHVALIRTVFALLCLAGGLGVLLYLAGWVLIPGEGQTDAIVQRWMNTGHARRWVGILLVGLAVIILGNATELIRGDLAFAVVLVGIGVMLYRGDLGRGDHRPEQPQPTSREVSSEGVEASAAPLAPSAAAAPPPPRERSYLGRVCLGIAVIALGTLGLFDEIIGGFHPDFYHYAALAVGVIGAGVVVGAWFGRPAGLVILGIFLLPILVISRLVAAGGADLMSIEFTSVGHVQHQPGSVEDIRSSYELGVGGLTIDLRDVDFEGETVWVETEVGIGGVLVRLPEGVAADVSGEVGIGTLQVGDRERSGVGVEADLRLEGSAGTLVLDSEVGIGEIEVRAWPSADRSFTYIPNEQALREEHRIRHAADLQDLYTLPAGSLRLDLGDLALEEDRVVTIAVDRGEVRVTVPDDVGLRITTRVDQGRFTLFDEVSEGSRLNSIHSTPISGAPLLTLDISLGVGNVTVEED